MNKEVRKFCRRLKLSGYTTAHSRSGHIKVYEPGGKLVTTISVSPSDRMWMQAAEKSIHTYGSLPLKD